MVEREEKVCMQRSVSEATKRIVAASYGWRCADCGELLDSTFQTDHIVPLHKGGSNEVDNLQPLCAAPCHARKTQREAIERAERKRRMRESAVSHRPPLECTGCGAILSPHFSHTCKLVARHEKK